LRSFTATEDIGILSSMLAELKIATKWKLDMPVCRALATISALLNLIEGDLREAFEYTGITMVENPYSSLASVPIDNTNASVRRHGLWIV
jgi:hypothetical protein